MAGGTKQHTVRVSESTHRALRRLIAVSGKSMTAVLERAVDRFEREQLFAEADAAWAAIQADPAAMAEIEAEQRLWDQTLMDGLAGDGW
jgi:hypothetical protein